METRSLGREGPQVSVVGLGCNNFGRRVDRDGTRGVVEAALAEGITLVDTADVYGDGASEEFLGAALGSRREDVVVATKFGHPMPGGPDVPRGSRAWIRFAVEGSLRRLATERIDVYQYHRPDSVTPMAETIVAMAELVREGKVRYLGISNVRPEAIEEAASAARSEAVRLVSVQNEYSLLKRDAEDDVLPACERLGLGFLPYFPLASGLLTGKYRRGEAPPQGTRLAERPDRLTDERFAGVEALERYAAQRGASLLEVAIGGLAAQPAVASVIAGATKPEQVRANAQAARRWRPSVEDLEELAVLR
ncbi:MAG: aldo/keto reductase [Actinomycetota bacterium]|nr:aldo/keto reductase [Actinomycetota bacterium]